MQREMHFKLLRGTLFREFDKTKHQPLSREGNRPAENRNNEIIFQCVAGRKVSGRDRPQRERQTIPVDIYYL